MRATLFMFSIFFLLSGCAYIDGIKNQNKVVPIPNGEASQQPASSSNATPNGNQATVQAAKIISPAVR